MLVAFLCAESLPQSASNEAWSEEPDMFRLWTYCAETGDPEQPSSYGLTPGRHKVVIEARLPAVDGRWTMDP